MIRKIGIILEMIKFEHTVFALPFAYMGMLLGNFQVEGTWPTFHEFLWVTLAMVGARSAAMALNRVIDREIDRRNPRTAMRAIPAGRISSLEVWLFVVASFALLILSAAQLNPLAVKLLPVAVFILVIYSYTKRFTWLCHLILGGAIALAPVGGWVAATGSLDWVAWLLYGTVALWTAGFDIIYATQDMDFDRKEGLYSIPARFGLEKALWIAKGLHLATAVGLILLYFATSLQWLFGVGVICAILILIYEHSIISPKDMSRLNTAFFTMNGILSVLVFLFTLLDLMVIR